MSIEKTCTSCGIPKDLDEFYNSPNGKFGKKSKCKDCQKSIDSARFNKAYTDNPQKFKDRSQDWSCRNPAKARARNKFAKKLESNRNWQLNNLSRKRELNSYWFANNKDKHNQHRRETRSLNRRERNEKERALRNKNIENYRNVGRINFHRRRAMVAKVGGSFTTSEFTQLQSEYGFKCLRCGISAENTPQKKLTADHIIPISKGGPNHISNIQPLCLSCNCSKGTRTVDYRNKVVLT
jgi:hypothetical protein